MNKTLDVISVIVPIYNGAKWIDLCFHSIFKQNVDDTQFQLEVCVCNDSSTDETSTLLEKWKDHFQEAGVSLKLFNNISENPGGVGFAKNKAVSVSTGRFLCFQDIDDVMLPDRVQKQFQVAVNSSVDTIVGAQFKREPEDSTVRYTKWANSLSQEQLSLQVFTSHGPTVIMPTWFLYRAHFDKVGGFVEKGKGTPEDLIFFYKHLDLGGKIVRVDECLLIYRFHSDQATFSVHQDTIWNLRVDRLQKEILSDWPQFTIWNAGKQGKKLYNSLSKENQAKVVAFCDVDGNKIGKPYIPYNPNDRKGKKKMIEIVHFKDALPPLVICVKMDMTGGVFENNLQSLNLQEGLEYVIFS
ncbi:unnamed protein product [Diabrotica balteata]|uniref:Glycosyltransferase 2-like domain-containing protein n=1 Tax=Diabrotica balteata TaxID=107213 RepID=A0A9N9XDE7_DIABA|nr:unnamed protein product [Diabrotica balteata]